jgi:hypothetical protein
MQAAPYIDETVSAFVVACRNVQVTHGGTRVVQWHFVIGRPTNEKRASRLMDK